MSHDTLDGMSVTELDALAARIAATRAEAIKREEEREWIMVPTERTHGEYRVRRDRSRLEWRRDRHEKWVPSAFAEEITSVLYSARSVLMVRSAAAILTAYADAEDAQ